jgi:formylglycine-generating enzyme required for sulfatase activity
MNPKLFRLLFVGILISIESNAQYVNPVTLSAKIIDKNLEKVADDRYAYKFETSNGEYNLFLEAIKKTDPALYTASLVDSTNWELRYQEPMMIYYHRHPTFAKYPVVNVSYEGAVNYCKWLTEFYNNDPKRKFRKVVFNLPDTTEWMLAARGGRANAMFPWGNYYLRNKQGEFLCNLKHINEADVISDSEGKPVIRNSDVGMSGGLSDRAFYTATVQSFYPNSFGIYNMSGNAAEMTNEKGITKGGSWNSYGGEVMIGAVKKFDKPSPEVGFRVFMKVIQK